MLLAWLGLAGTSLATDFSAVFQRNTNSVVTIQAGRNIGTGFYATEHFIVTNLHVIAQAPSLNFCNTYKGGFTKVESIVVGDWKNDLAILYTEKTGVPVVFAKSAELVPGMELASIGSPHGYEKSFASGNFSQMRQNGLMQITIPESPGASGSPVFNNAGLVVGVVVAQRKEAQNLNFAIPSERVVALVEKAKTLPKGNYIDLKRFRLDQSDGQSATYENSVASDYVHIDVSLAGCQHFRSVFFERPRQGPIKKCVCNERVMYTNAFCQCHPCRNKERAGN